MNNNLKQNNKRFSLPKASRKQEIPESKPLPEGEAANLLNQLKLFGSLATPLPGSNPLSKFNLGNNLRFKSVKPKSGKDLKENDEVGFLHSFALLRKELNSNKNLDEIVNKIEANRENQNKINEQVQSPMMHEEQKLELNHLDNKKSKI